jgi:tetratricopeptide (TPR) repeat protein
VAVPLVVFALCWWGWERLRLPPAGTDRLGVALAVAAVVSAALAAPFVSWAGHDRVGEPGRDAAGLVQGRPAGAVVVGEIPRQPTAFVARETVGRLTAAAGSGQVAVLCAVTGLRGVGKTQVAAAYARDWRNQGWELVAWVNAESRDVLLAGLARVADALGVADPEGDSAESARRLRDHLETRPSRGLLVFDNATDPGELRPFLPATGSTQIIVTSTIQAFAEMGVRLDVSVFTRPEAVGYLTERTGLADVAGADAVGEELGDLPLGLAQAAATITGRHLTYTTYLELLLRVPVDKVLGHAAGDEYPRPVGAALVLSIESAEDAQNAELARLVSLLLRVVAALSPDGVRREFLNGLTTNDSEGLVDAAVQRCAEGSLLTWSQAGDAVIMHRLVGRVLRERDQTAGRWASTVRAALGLLEPLLFPEDQAWSLREEGADLAAQFEALWQADAAAGTADRELAVRLLRARSQVVQKLIAAEDLSRAFDAGSRTLADCERVLGADHRRTLTSRQNLARAFESAGRLGEAIPLFEQNVADCERVLGADDPDTLVSRNYLAGAYGSAGRLGEAIPLLEQDLGEFVRVLGPDHRDTLTARNDLAHAYGSAGRLGEEIRLHKQNLADRARVLGADDPDTLMSQDNLAAAYRSAGRPGEAIALHKQALADYLRVLGPDNPDTLISRTNLAYAYQSAGRAGEAIPLYEQTLADRERVLGPDHPDTLISRTNLAYAYESAGRLGEAIPLYEQNLAETERVLGPDHRDTLTSRNNLACAYQSAGRAGEAIPLFEQNLAETERVLGPDHPDTLTSRNNLAYAYRPTGKPPGDSIPSA